MHTTDARQAYTRSRSSRSGSFSEEVETMHASEEGTQATPRGDVRCAFSLPLDKGDELPALFGALRGVAESVAFSTTTLEDVFLAVGEDDAVHNVAKVNERGESYKALYDPESIVDVPRSLIRHSSAILRLRGRLAFNDLITVLLPCLLYTSPSPRDQRGSRMPSSA